MRQLKKSLLLQECYTLLILNLVTMLPHLHHHHLLKRLLECRNSIGLLYTIDENSKYIICLINACDGHGRQQAKQIYNSMLERSKHYYIPCLFLLIQLN